MKIIKSLMTQFLLAATILVAAVAALTFSQQQAGQLLNTLSNWKNQADKIQLDLANLQQQAQHYKLNAPRDFESYNRDVAVFFNQFNQQLQLLQQSFDHANNSVITLTQHPSYDFLAQADSPMLNAIQIQSAWHSFWLIFLNELEAEIGNPQQPRLEWAAEYIIAQQQQLNLQAAQLASSVEQTQQWFAIKAEQLNIALIIFVLGYLLLSLLFIATRVIRPVVTTARACQAVASGEYGLKIELQGAGETRRLQHAFNELSARSKLMLDLLGDINKPGDVADKLQCIYDSGREALGSNWIGLMAFSDNSIDLNTSVPAVLDQNFRHRSVSLHKTLGKDLIKTVDNGWLDIQSLSQLSLTRHDERFLRELHKNTMATQVVGYPFKCPKHNNFILMFSSNHKEGFNKQQVELIKALSKLMADAIISGMEQAPSDELIAGNIIPLQSK